MEHRNSKKINNRGLGLSTRENIGKETLQKSNWSREKSFSYKNNIELKHVIHKVQLFTI